MVDSGDGRGVAPDPTIWCTRLPTRRTTKTLRPYLVRGGVGLWLGKDDPNLFFLLRTSELRLILSVKFVSFFELPAPSFRSSGLEGNSVSHMELVLMSDLWLEERLVPEGVGYEGLCL